jgi:ABC-type amino acid transport substrate-binding protein
MKRFLIILAATAVIAGCGTSKTQVEADYGKSVRAMINAQVADPNTLTNPSTAPVTGADPDMVNAAVNALRGEVSKPEDVKRDIVLKVGGK